MARLPTVPPPEIRLRMRGKIQVASDRGIIVAKKWPSKRPGKGTEAQARARALFKEWVASIKLYDPIEIANAKIIAKNSGYTWRDVLFRASIGRMVEWDMAMGGEMPDFNVQSMLDQLSPVEGAIIVKAGGVWVILPPGSTNQVLTMDGALNLPNWLDLPPAGIDQLTGDGTAGPGTGSQVFTLSNTGVTAGSYTLADITVDAKGRITSASDGSASGGIDQLTGDGTAGPGTGSQVFTLSNAGVTAGSYTLADITVDAKGRITSASDGTPPAYIDELTGDGTAGPGSGSQVFTLADTGVTPGTYSNAEITVDSKGRATAVTAGSGAAAGSGQFAQVRGATPTSSSTGLTTWLNQGGATVADRATGISISMPGGAGDNVRGRYKNAPSTPYTIKAQIAHLGPTTATSQSWQTQLGWYDGTNKIQVIHFESLLNALNMKVAAWNSPTVFGGTQFTGVPTFSPIVWVQIKDDGTNVYFQYGISGDDNDFITFYSVAKASGFLGSSGYSKIFFGANHVGTGNGWNSIHSLLSYKEY